VTRISAALLFLMSSIILGSHSQAIRWKLPARDYILSGALTIRGVSREVKLTVNYLGQWRTPW
jgi:polyisoprenoid-binding protein YceI